MIFMVGTTAIKQTMILPRTRPLTRHNPLTRAAHVVPFLHPIHDRQPQSYRPSHRRAHAQRQQPAPARGEQGQRRGHFLRHRNYVKCHLCFNSSSRNARQVTASHTKSITKHASQMMTIGSRATARRDSTTPPPRPRPPRSTARRRPAIARRRTGRLPRLRWSP